MKISRSWAALILLAVLSCSCSNSDSTSSSNLVSEAVLPLSENVTAGLPAPSELRGTSTTVFSREGSSFDFSHNALAQDASAMLEYKGATIPGTDINQYSYAVYLFNGVSELPPILTVQMHGDFTSRLYPAVANWRTNRWEFGFGHIYSYADHNFPLPSLEELPDDFRSDTGQVAFALLKVDNDGPSFIDGLSFWQPDEVLNVVASEGLWDGIDVSWEVPGGTNYVQIERRAQGVAAWQLITPEPIAANLITYKDITADGGIYYEYRVSGGYRWDTVLGEQFYWTSGKKAIGLRNVDTVTLGMNQDEYLVPGNSFNRLSFYFAPTNDAHGVHAVRNTSFPPGQDWELFDETSTNFPYLNIAEDPDLGPAISVFQLNELNNPLINIAYSDGTGAYSYAALLDQEGHFNWLDPGQVRTGNNHVLGSLALERRLACFTWNDDTNRIEFVESVDQEGTFWWEFNDQAKYAIVTDRHPTNGICVSPTMRQSIAFREKGTNGVIVCRKGADGWETQVVGVETSSQPVLQNIKTNQLDNTAAVIYRDMDNQRIRLVRSFEGETWLTNQQETLVLVKGADQIGEFCHYMLEPPSNFNVLAYTHNGDLKFKFSSKTGQDVWSEEFLIDDSGTCRNLNITRIGTDLQWQYFTFLSYIRTDEFGVAQLKFLDLNSFLESNGLL